MTVFISPYRKGITSLCATSTFQNKYGKSIHSTVVKKVNIFRFWCGTFWSDWCEIMARLWCYGGWAYKWLFTEYLFVGVLHRMIPKWALLDLFLAHSLDNFNHPLTKSTAGNAESSPVPQSEYRFLNQFSEFRLGLAQAMNALMQCVNYFKIISVHICTNMQEITPSPWIIMEEKKTIFRT